MIEPYYGPQGLADFNTIVEHVPGLTVSPGGAAAILGVSRQRVDELIRTSPRIRAWAFYPHVGAKRAALLYVSVRDLVLYGVQQGRLSCAADSGLSFPTLADEIELARQAVDKATEALLY